MTVLEYGWKFDFFLGCFVAVQPVGGPYALEHGFSNAKIKEHISTVTTYKWKPIASRRGVKILSLILVDYIGQQIALLKVYFDNGKKLF